MEQPVDNKRLFIAVAVSMAILLVWQIFVFEPPPPPEEEEATEETSEDTEATDQTAAQTDEPDQAHTADAPRDDADGASLGVDVPPRLATLESERFQLRLTNQGGGATSYIIKEPSRYADRDNFVAPVLDDPDAEVPEGDLPLSMSFQNLPLGPTTPLEVLEEGEHVRMSWASPDGLASVEKVFSHGETEFAINLEVTVFNKGSKPLNDSVEISIFNRTGEGDEPGFFGPGRPVDASCLTDDDVERVSGDDEAESYSASVEWVSVGEPYFVMLARLEDGADECTIEGSEAGLVTATLRSDISVDAGASTVLQYEIYFGPKEQAVLDAFGHGAFRTVDYGWFEFLSRPIAWLLNKLYGFLGNWGLAIILLTILIRGALWPVTQRSQESMMRMKDISPLMKELQEKYKNDPTMLQQKQMELFREHNVSPFGCLPLLLQIPIWFALYRTILVTAELYNADFGFWIHDLSSPDPFYILPVVAGGLFFVQQRLSPTTSTDVKQKVLMTVFPLVFVVVMLFLPSGLNLYILMSSIIGLAQVLYTKRKSKNKKKGGASPSDGDSDPVDHSPKTAAERRAARRRKGRA